MKRKGPQRDVKKRQFWQDTVRRWRQSGQAVRDYCRDNALSEPSFYAWRRELSRRKPSSPTASRATRQAPMRQHISGTRRAAASFLPVRLVEGAMEAGRPPAGHPLAGAAACGSWVGGVEIVLACDRTVRVRAGFDRQTLANVLAVLEGRPC